MDSSELLPAEINGEGPPSHFQCYQCPASFGSKALLARHISLLHKPVKKYKCTQCSSAFNSSKNLSLHRVIHGQRPFKCPKCAIIFRRHATYVGHIKQHFESEDHICAVCDREFQSLEALKVHVYEGHDEGLRKKDGPKKINLIRSPGKKSFKCTICVNKVFSKQSLLERHFLIHTKKKPFKCEICDKSFNQKSSLNTHALTHSKVQEFVCMLCGIKFSQKVNLRVHTLRVHPKRTISLADRLPCPYCPCLFKKLGSLNAHKTKVHAAILPDMSSAVETQTHNIHVKQELIEPAIRTVPNVKNIPVGRVYKCATCDMIFQNMSQFGKHMERHTTTNRTFESAALPATDVVLQPVVASRSQNHLQGTSEQRRYSCTICPAAFKKSSHLKQHLKSHYGIKGNRCEICNKTFTTSHTLKVHRKSHSQSSQLHYKCDQCSSSFSLQSSLRRHTKLHENPDQNYTCPYCTRIFKWFQNCKTHIRLTHAKEFCGEILEPVQNLTKLEARQENANATQLETVHTIEEADETLIDLNNLPANVSIVDISNLTNCILKIDDQLYEIPVHIETEKTDLKGQRFFDLHEVSQEVTTSGSMTGQQGGIDVQQTNSSMTFVMKNMKLGTTEDTLYQYINETSEDVLVQEEICDEPPNSPEHDKNPVVLVPALRAKSKDTKPTNRTEQDLFSEVVEDGKKKYCCKGCNKMFKKPVDLRRHIRTHTGERPFRCEHCSKSFTLKAVLQSHLKTHETQREMLICPETGCLNKFSSKSSLELHRRIHTGTRPFLCRVCALTFRTSGHLQAHMSSHSRLAFKREQSNLQFGFQK